MKPCRPSFMWTLTTRSCGRRAASPFPFHPSSCVCASFTHPARYFIAGAQAARTTHAQSPSVSVSFTASQHFSRSPLYSSTTKSRRIGLDLASSILHSVAPMSQHPETPNQALQRTAPAVTLAAPPPSPAQPSRQPPPSLSLGSLGYSRKTSRRNEPLYPARRTCHN